MKVPDIGFPQGTHPTTYEFYGWVRGVLNDGRYQLRVINSAPTWTTNDGEILAVDDDNGKSLYLFVTDTWYSVPLTTAGTGGTVPTGGIIPWGGTDSTVPNGWALCNGAAASRSTYASLFSVLGTKYGAGDGVTTFNLPDMRGRVPLGCDNMKGAAGRVTIEAGGGVVGGAGGSQNLQQHLHTMTHGAAPGSGAALPCYGSAGGSPANFNTNYTGVGGSENLMPYQTSLYIIKL